MHIKASLQQVVYKELIHIEIQPYVNSMDLFTRTHLKHERKHVSYPRTVSKIVQNLTNCDSSTKRRHLESVPSSSAFIWPFQTRSTQIFPDFENKNLIPELTLKKNFIGIRWRQIIQVQTPVKDLNVQRQVGKLPFVWSICLKLMFWKFWRQFI